MQELGKRQELLLKALESGKYPKGVGYLNREGEYCCVGVAFEVAMQNGLDVVKIEDFDDLDLGIYYYNGEISIASNELVEWFGFYECAHTKYIDNKDGKTRSFYGLNDYVFKDDKDFSRLVALIRKDPSMFFREAK